MAHKFGVVMTLCPNCRSIQKANSICTICKYPIPDKGTEDEEVSKGLKEARSGLVQALDRLAQFEYRPRFEMNEDVETDDETTEPDLPIGVFKRPSISERQRVAINMQLIKAGFDGNGRFDSPSDGITKASEILSKNGIELDTVVNSWALTQYDDFRLNLDLAWSNEHDPFSPVPIQNSMLVFTWYKFPNDKFECLAYLS